MDDECQVNKLEQQLKEAGQQLSFPPSSIKHLLNLLDETERLLTCVDQSPSVSMQGALAPSMGALIGDELIKHSDTNVKVSLASCLSEIARITAPEPSYNDEIMKEIFKLNVMAFGELSNMNSLSYLKAIHILRSVADVNSFLLMLDIDCDDLVLAMFEQFLSKIRSTHPHRVYSDMKYIMTLVIKESDELNTELLSCLILHVRKENQNVSPVSWKLAEKVLMNCVDTLKPYSETITKLIKSDPDSYAEVVTLLCHKANGNELVVTKWTKRRIISLDNGGCTKKLKYIDSGRLNEKELKTSKKGRPKNKGRPKKLKQDLVGCRIKVWWPMDKKYYKGAVSSYDSITDRYKVLYVDGDEEVLDLHNEKWIKLRNLKNNPVQTQGLHQETPKKWKQDLVGCRIKVWCPLDKMYYKVVVSSYDSITDKYEVLYADGDEEVLNLHHEKWMIIDDPKRIYRLKKWTKRDRRLNLVI